MYSDMHASMEHSFNIQQRKPQQGAHLGWTQHSVLHSEAGAAPSQSASSVVISPGSGNNGDTPSEEISGQSGSSLKEHDYIGLAEVSSAPSKQVEKDIELNLAETDLRLGLGPATEPPLDRVSESKNNERTPSLTSSRPEGIRHIQDDTYLPPSMSSTWQSVPVMTSPPINGFQVSAMVAASKNGGKRMYADAMVDPRSTIHLNSASDAIITGESKLSITNPVISIKQLQDPDVKSHIMHSQGLYWAAPHVPSWQAQAADHQRASSFRPVASRKGMIQPVTNEDNGPDEAPPAKGQVVGWPPVRSYRRSTLATSSKPAGDEGDSQSAIYVKVNMDGIPIGRKVDLKAYISYDGLLSALEDMFHNPNNGHGARFLEGSEFVLTYEDKEGDWMLVGDVPWGMFVNTVRRLRITRGSDMTGLGTRASTCHA